MAMKDAILSVLEGECKSRNGRDDGGEVGNKIKVKKLRKLVLLSLQRDEGEKSAKKKYKKAVQELEEEGKLLLDAEGLVSPTMNTRQHKSSGDNNRSSGEKKEKKSKKRKRKEDGEVDNDEGETPTKKQNSIGEEEEETGDVESTPSSKSRNTPCKGNPQGVTRLFVGNLPFAVDEASLKTFLPGLTHVKWITDKETGAFYGSSFVEMEDSGKAADAVAKAGSDLMGRPIKVNFAPARPGDVWPPDNNHNKKAVTGGGSGQAGGSGVKAMSAKPPDCKKLFIGNLSYDIDDDGITKFFANVDAEIKAVRWLHHKDSGDFKGCGFVEFWNSEDCSKGAALNGKNLLGRPIRIDWSD